MVLFALVYLYHGFQIDRGRLVVPNMIGFVMIAVILVVQILFFSPFLETYAAFSVGTEYSRIDWASTSMPRRCVR